MAEGKYATVIFEANSPEGTGRRYAMVAVPEGERMVVVVTEGGKWPEDEVFRVVWGLAMAASGPMYDRAVAFLDALAEQTAIGQGTGRSD